MAGRVRLRRLFLARGQADPTDFGPARSPAGPPIERLVAHGDVIYARDAAGNIYRWAGDRTGWTPTRVPSQAPDNLRWGWPVPRDRQSAGETWLPPRAQVVDMAAAEGWTAYLVEDWYDFCFNPQSGTFAPATDCSEPNPAMADGQSAGQSAGPIVPAPDGWVYLPPQRAVHLQTGASITFPRLPIHGVVRAATLLADGRLVAGTDHGGSLFVLDLRTGAAVFWGRPLPELGVESGEEVAPIVALATGPDDLVYGAVGSGATGDGMSHLFRLDPSTARVIDSTAVPLPLSLLVTGDDGLVYGAAGAQLLVFRENPR